MFIDVSKGQESSVPLTRDRGKQTVPRAFSGYNRGGEQFSHGLFLILMVDGDKDWLKRTPEEKKAVRGLVRFVRMGQSGHFMVAFVNIKGHRIYLSGTYGADGLLKDVPHAVYELGLDLPPELYEAWAKGGGHNSAGSEAEAMHRWAQENLKRLRNQ